MSQHEILNGIDFDKFMLIMFILILTFDWLQDFRNFYVDICCSAQFSQLAIPSSTFNIVLQ